MNSLKIRLTNWIIKKSFKGVVPADVISFESRKDEKGRPMTVVRIGDNELTQTEKEKYSTHAKELQMDYLLNQIENTLVNNAHKTIYESSTNFEEVISGKTLLYAIDLKEKILEAIANIK